MTDLRQLKQLIHGLRPSERAQLAYWLDSLARDDGRMRGRDHRVAEPHAFPSSLGSARLSVESYLELEDSAHVRHEYLAGEAFAMAGASPRHNRIAVRLVNAIAERIAGEPCDVYMSDVKLKVTIDQDQYFYYPDVMVACAREREQAQYVENPKLIVEVLSTSTEAIDRREKAIHYRFVPTLEEYVIVAQERPEVTIHRREGGWSRGVIEGETGVAELRSIGLSLPLTQLYAGVPNS